VEVILLLKTPFELVEVMLLLRIPFERVEVMLLLGILFELVEVMLLLGILFELVEVMLLLRILFAPATRLMKSWSTAILSLEATRTKMTKRTRSKTLFEKVDAVKRIPIIRSEATRRERRERRAAIRSEEAQTREIWTRKIRTVVFTS
jgi:predicted membrane protein